MVQQWLEEGVPATCATWESDAGHNRPRGALSLREHNTRHGGNGEFCNYLRTVRYLIDENMPSAVVEYLRNAGHDVAWVLEDSPSTSDPTILDRASQEDRVLVTFDKEDFGSLIFAGGAEAQCGVILCRFRDTDRPNQEAFMSGILDTNTPWAGKFSFIRTGPTPTG